MTITHLTCLALFVIAKGQFNESEDGIVHHVHIVRVDALGHQRRSAERFYLFRTEYLHQDEKEMLTLWLADKFIDAVEDEQERDLCNDAIIVAQEKIKTL